MLIYKITNSVNDRVYIGLTTCTLAKRWREHLCSANTGVEKPLYRAMRKYGTANFKIEVVYTATSVEDLRVAELRYIKEYKAHALENGYNLTDHGYQHGKANQTRGETVYNSKVTEDIVAFIRDPQHWDRSNQQMLELVKEKFGFVGARDTIRDARRGDAWKHLNDRYPPVRVGQGTRKSPLSEEQKAKLRASMLLHAEKIHARKVEARANKRAPNAKLSEETVRNIFYNQAPLLKTAEQFGVSKKMVLLIKQRKAHVYLTKDL
jgi:group I intron endonuclease